ncbi:MAG: shikimate dehydrogenase [Gammaproteobacteria bacterium]|nr:shikimate dehydrogenase [Gammaproteobacteria bacterium]
MATVRLGLIGDNIAASQAPRLHRLAGELRGITVRYDLLVPAELGLGFDALFERCTDGSYHGVNVTHPYKERAAARVGIESPLVRAMGAVNLVRFDPERPRGFNTDHTGFLAAWRAKFGAETPGVVCQVGAGGAGRAIGFALAVLGADAIRLVDIDRGRAQALAEALRSTCPELDAAAAESLEEAASGARGLVNCSPVGMDGHDGTPVPRAFMDGAAWAFDAVYTPVRTPFLADAEAVGLDPLSGYELFFHQGADGLEIFLGEPVDRVRLRRALGEPGRACGV